MEGHSKYVTSVSFSPDGKTVVSGSWDVTIILWDVATGNNIKTLKGHRNRVVSVSFSPDRKTVVSGSDDGTVRWWDVETGENIKTADIEPDRNPRRYYSHHLMVSFSPDGGRIAVTRNRTIEIYILEKKAFLRNYLKHTKGWDHKKFIQELDPNLMDSAELKELDEYHPDNLLEIMSKLPEDIRTKFNLTIRTPKQTPSTKKKKGNVKPLIESDCKKLDAMYRKYENDLDKLTIVRKKVNKLIKDIKNDKKFNIRREVTSKKSMPSQRKTRKKPLSHASI